MPRTLLAALALSAFVLVNAEQRSLEQQQHLRDALKARSAESARELSSSNYWYLDDDQSPLTSVCPQIDEDSGTCFSPSFPLGSTICTNAGGLMIVTHNGSPNTVVKSTLAIPPECLTSPGTTREQCTAINQLWNSKFKYCCPLWSSGVSFFGNGYFPQLTINDPKALGPFFSPIELEAMGYPSLVAAKWVGQGNKGGCRLFFDCAGNKDKSSCKAAGGWCKWMGTAGCQEDPIAMTKIKGFTYLGPP